MLVQDVRSVSFLGRKPHRAQLTFDLDLVLVVHPSEVLLQLEVDPETSCAMLAREGERLVVGLVVEIVFLAREFLITVFAGKTFLEMHTSMPSQCNEVAEGASAVFADVLWSFPVFGMEIRHVLD